MVPGGSLDRTEFRSAGDYICLFFYCRCCLQTFQTKNESGNKQSANFLQAESYTAKLTQVVFSHVCSCAHIPCNYRNDVGYGGNRCDHQPDSFETAVCMDYYQAGL